LVDVLFCLTRCAGAGYLILPKNANNESLDIDLGSAAATEASPVGIKVQTRRRQLAVTVLQLALAKRQ
jgi:hypothetical protein